MSTKTTKANKTTKAKVYVGIRETAAFVRSFEEREDDEEDLTYRVFSSVKKPTKKTHPGYNCVIGPFPNKRSAEIFRDEVGVNTVEQATIEAEAT
jgi:hypothetical protein